MTTTPIQPQPIPIPLDLHKNISGRQIPWEISERVFGEMRTQTEAPFKKVEVLPTDPEWHLIWRYFHADKPRRYGIGRVYCIHENSLQKVFESSLSSIEKESQKLKPTWNQEPRAPQRAGVIERWKMAANVFSPFDTMEKDGRRKTWKNTKVMPLWHANRGGASVYNSIAESGFIYFGKNSMGVGIEGDQKSTDPGFFGSGIYFTNSARYASDVYSRGEILMAWVSMREPFPVVGDNKQEDMKYLKGKSAYKHYNAHYVPVTSHDPNNPYEAEYFPSKEGEKPHCDEIVVFHKSQALPRFWIELVVEMPYLMKPSEVPEFVNELIPHIMKMLQNASVDKDQKLRNYLCGELGFLMKLPGDDYLDEHGGNKYEKLYDHFTRLIKAGGKVDRAVSRLITKTPAASGGGGGGSKPEKAKSTQAKPKKGSFWDLFKSKKQAPEQVVQKPLVVASGGGAKGVSAVATISISEALNSKSYFFGRARWNKHFGDVGVEPPLPANIVEILKGPCPYWKGEEMGKTHMLVLIPAIVNGEPFTLNSLGEMIKAPREGHATKYTHYSSTVKEEIGDRAPGKSYWVLMTNDVLPNSRRKTYAEQVPLLKGSYAVPRALEAATAILMHHVSTGERRYSDNPWTYTRCEEVVVKEYHMAAGGFQTGGLLVFDGTDSRDHSRGLSGVRKF